jgi:hypothetical protein
MGSGNARFIPVRDLSFYRHSLVEVSFYRHSLVEPAPAGEDGMSSRPTARLAVLAEFIADVAREG